MQNENKNERVEFPELYKKTSTGAIQFWRISVDPCAGTGENIPSEIVTVYGQQFTDKPQTTYDVILEGKNIGRANETTAHQQAVLEAEARWTKQKKKGYVLTPILADAGDVDEIIEGGIVPMLAQSFSKHGSKIIYPAYVQPKLDGIRCIAIIENGKCTLWSRTRKLITGVPHIARELEKAFGHKGHLILDGELYNHEFKSDFEKIVSFVRQEDPAEGHEVVQYHVYDMATERKFEDRINSLATLVHLQEKSTGLLQYVHVVSTHRVMEESQAVDAFELFKSQGYEGAMIRNTAGLYVNKRSYDLQKIKEFDDAEFEITGIEEGRGKLAGHAIFVCKTDSGSKFLAKMKGENARLKEYFDNHSLWQGKKLTVQYQGLTGKEKVPRFPVGVAIRDYE